MSIVFAAVGMSNLALVAVIGSVALREKSITTWLIYPCTVFVLQGAAWLMAYTLRRRAWLGLVALGWFVTALGMGWAVGSHSATTSSSAALACCSAWRCPAG